MVVEEWKYIAVVAVAIAALVVVPALSAAASGAVASLLLLLCFQLPLALLVCQIPHKAKPNKCLGLIDWA